MNNESNIIQLRNRRKMIIIELAKINSPNESEEKNINLCSPERIKEIMRFHAFESRLSEVSFAINMLGGIND